MFVVLVWFLCGSCVHMYACRFDRPRRGFERITRNRLASEHRFEIDACSLSDGQHVQGCMYVPPLLAPTHCNSGAPSMLSCQQLDPFLLTVRAAKHNSVVALSHSPIHQCYVI